MILYHLKFVFDAILLDFLPDVLFVSDLLDSMIYLFKNSLFFLLFLILHNCCGC